jgi:3-dehydroquinate synthase
LYGVKLAEAQKAKPQIVIREERPTSAECVIRVKLKQSEDNSYDILIQNGLLSKIPSDLKERKLGNRFALITDTNVSALYGQKLTDLLNDEGLETKIFVFEAGERNKKLRTCEDIMNNMSFNGFGRDSVVVALGGGVVGDMSGFIAAIFNRGVPYVQIPTTFLAQADSSVGGKTGVDTEFGKNLVGAFKQPKVVYIDPLTIRTLPQIEYISGLGETVKHGIIRDINFFNYIEDNKSEVLKMTDEVLLHLAQTNCSIKAAVVEIDPHEKGLRRILNLGHTIGHAVEKLSNYELPHGHCVAIGIMPALRIARQTTDFPMEDLIRVEKLFESLNLPTQIPFRVSNEDIIKATTLDKKAAKGQARYCLPIRIGEMASFDGQYVTLVDEPLVRQALYALRQYPPGTITSSKT